MRSDSIQIDTSMTRGDLLKLKPRWAKWVSVLVDGEKYPLKQMKADDVENCVGINGRIVFTK